MNLMQWSGTPGPWSDAQLPRVDPRADLVLQRWCVVAGGLALMLSRAGDTERRCRLSGTQRLYETIRDGLERSQPVLAGPELIGEVMHEIAETADGLTRQCLKACFEASLRGGTVDAAASDSAPMTQAPHSTHASALVSQPRPSRLSAAGLEPVDTRINAEMFAERANALRERVAAARKNATPR